MHPFVLHTWEVTVEQAVKSYCTRLTLRLLLVDLPLSAIYHTTFTSIMARSDILLHCH